MKYILKNGTIPAASERKPLVAYVNSVDGKPTYAVNPVTTTDIKDGKVDLSHLTRKILPFEAQTLIDFARANNLVSGYTLSDKTAKKVEDTPKITGKQHYGKIVSDQWMPDLAAEILKNKLKYSAIGLENDTLVTDGGYFYRKAEWDRTQDGITYYAYASIDDITNISWARFFTEEYSETQGKELNGYSLNSDNDTLQNAGTYECEYHTAGYAGEITINYGYRNEDAFLIVSLDNYKMIRKSEWDTVQDSVTYYAYASAEDITNIYWACFLTEEYNGVEEKDLNLYYKDDDTDEIMLNDSYTVKNTKYDVNYTGPLEQVLALTNGENNEVEYEGDCVSMTGNSLLNPIFSLTDITIPGSMTSIGNYTFQGGELTSITIGSGVTSIGESALENCENLTAIIYTGTKEQWNNIEFGENWNNNSPVVVIHCSDGDIVSAYYKLTYADGSIVYATTNNVENKTNLVAAETMNLCEYIPDGTFKDCTALTSITIGDNVTAINLSAFTNCTSLTDVTIPASVTSISGGAFSACSSLTGITFLGAQPTIGSKAFAGVPSTGTCIYPREESYPFYAKALGLPYTWTIKMADFVPTGAVWLSAGTDEYLLNAFASLKEAGLIANDTYVTDTEGYNLRMSYIQYKGMSYPTGDEIETQQQVTAYSDDNSGGGYYVFGYSSKTWVGGGTGYSSNTNTDKTPDYHLLWINTSPTA